jgi:uncharacterized UBP type Zn finger protein
LISALRSLYIHISQNPADKGTIAPRAFIDKLKELNESFRNTMHQDAHEFLNYLLNKIVEEIEEEKKFLQVPVDDCTCKIQDTHCFPTDSNFSRSFSQIFIYCVATVGHDSKHVELRRSVNGDYVHTPDIRRYTD